MVIKSATSRPKTDKSWLIAPSILMLFVMFLWGCAGGSSSDSTDTTDATDTTDTVVVSAYTDTVIDTDSFLVINEIVAKDVNGGADWIEFYNRGSATINLGDYSVRDENTALAVSLPDVDLLPGSFYVVSATDESLNGVATVNIKLGAGDSVFLYQGEDLIDSLEWSKGKALFGFSFGRFPDGSTNTQTLTPSNAAANQTAERGPLLINEIVNQDAAGGSDWFELYNNSDTSIELSQYSVIDDSADIDPISLPNLTLAPQAHVVIYATDEGTENYSVGFKLGKEDSLSLILNGETVDYLDWDESDAPSGYSYGAVVDGAWRKNTLALTMGEPNSEVNPFVSDRVENIYIEIDPTNWANLLTNALNKETYEASATYLGVALGQVGFRTKGNSSLDAVYKTGSQRFSFVVDMNEYVDGQKLLGLKKLNLNNNYKDPTSMRETLAYELMREVGLPAPRTSYVNVYINGNLHGLYTMVEAIDSEFLERNMATENGDLYKPDTPDEGVSAGQDLLWIDENFSSYPSIELQTNEDSTDNAALMKLLTVINHGGDIEAVADQEAILKYLAVSTALSNMDSYQGSLAHNYYLYEQDGVFSVIPWDLNESFGTFKMGCSNSSMLALFIDEPTSGALEERPLIASLLAVAEYKATYHGYLQTLIDGPLSLANIENKIATIEELIATHVAADPTAFYTSAQFQSALTNDTSETFGLTNFVQIRNANVQDQLDGVAEASGNGAGSCSAGGVDGPLDAPLNGILGDPPTAPLNGPLGGPAPLPPQ